MPANYQLVMKSIFTILTSFFIFAICFQSKCWAAPPGMSSLYNKFFLARQGYRYARPVVNNSDPVIMYMNLSLVQILNVDEKNQIITLNLWVLQEWVDPFFQWNPEEYGNVDHILLPPDALWTPDLVLYTNSGGEWDLGQTSTKVKIYHTGRVVWKPPIIWESSCDINVEFFPFDIQDCKLKMGTWTYNGLYIDLRHLAQKQEDELLKRTDFDNCESDINYAIDLSEYVENTEWDLLEVSATRNIAKYTCCPEPYLDITFLVKFQRQTLFYGINLISPCLCISSLTLTTFYLPCDSQEKHTLSTFILLSLVVFFLLVFELVPPTSLVVPLITKYLLFTMILICLSLFINTVVLNVRYRSPEEKVPYWAKQLFIHVLPPILFMDRPGDLEEREGVVELQTYSDSEESSEEEEDDYDDLDESASVAAGKDIFRKITSALRGVRFITKKIVDDSSSGDVEEEWTFIAMVLDRFFLLSFTISSVIGSVGIFYQAPTLTSTNIPLRAHKFLDYEANLTFSRRCDASTFDIM